MVMVNGRGLPMLPITRETGNMENVMAFGFSVADKSQLRIGEWVLDKYKGERLDL